MAATRRRQSETPVPASGSDDSSDGGAAKGFECNVCLEPASEPVITRCGHLYCWPCLHRWIERHAGPAPCPVCKAAVTADTCTPIYGRGMDPEVADPRMRTRTRNTRSGVVAASAPGRPAATYVAAPEPIMAAAAGGDPIILGGHNPLDAQTISVSYAPGIGLIPGLFGLTLCARRRAPMHPWESLELRRHKATLNAALVAAVGALVAAIVLL